MTVTPLSGDFLLKTALVIGGVALAVWAARRASAAAAAAAGQVWDSAGQAVDRAGQAVRDGAWAVTPWNNENVFYDGINRQIWPDGSDTLGTAAYTLTDDLAQWWNDVTGTQGWTTGQGRWNNPSAYTAERGGTTPGYSGSGGAAFGIYPRP